MTIPRELKLIQEDEEYLLVSVPVVEMKKLRKKKFRKTPQVISG